MKNRKKKPGQFFEFLRVLLRSANFLSHKSQFFINKVTAVKNGRKNDEFRKTGISLNETEFDVPNEYLQEKIEAPNLMQRGQRKFYVFENVM